MVTSRAQAVAEGRSELDARQQQLINDLMSVSLKLGYMTRIKFTRIREQAKRSAKKRGRK